MATEGKDTDQTRSVVLMSAEQFQEATQVYVLPHEIALLESLVTKLREERVAAVEIFAEAMAQSSETYHDNAPADAARDECNAIGSRIQQLAGLATNHVLLEYPSPDQEEIAVGSKVLLSIDDTEPFYVEVVGASLLGREAYVDQDGNDVEFVTYLSPIGQAVLGKKYGDNLEADLNGRQASLTIIEVMQLAQAS